MLVIFYRLVEDQSPALWDFMSQKERGRPLQHQTRRAVRFWDGLSVYQTEEQARQLAVASPRLGGFIAEVRIPTDAQVTVQFETGRHGHCTVWGDATRLLTYVVDVAQV